VLLHGRRRTRLETPDRLDDGPFGLREFRQRGVGDHARHRIATFVAQSIYLSFLNDINEPLATSKIKVVEDKLENDVRTQA
jgi:hypothetical protein